MAYNITEFCDGCTACAKLCPVFAINGEKNTRHVINEKRCVECGVCGKVCQKGAIVNGAGETCSPVKRSEWAKPVIDTKICTACSICVHDCTKDVLRISLPQFHGDINVFAELFQPQKCVGCGICESNCPVEAIKMEVKPL